jgi:hypothetical protein
MRELTIIKAGGTTLSMWEKFLMEDTSFCRSWVGGIFRLFGWAGILNSIPMWLLKCKNLRSIILRQPLTKLKFSKRQSNILMIRNGWRSWRNFITGRNSNFLETIVTLYNYWMLSYSLGLLEDISVWSLRF